MLVVDDQIELAENIAEILQGIGFQTDVAGSAEDGLERVARGGITAVVTDFKLPGQSGAQLIEELRRRGERMPVLMMSAYTDEATIDRSRAAGAWFFLPKPVPLVTLVETFESLAQQPATTLLVDDEEHLAQNLAEALTAAGHEVVVTHTAADALAQSRRLHTAVLDYRLPDGTGLEVARQLRARGTPAYCSMDAGPHVKVLTRAGDAALVGTWLRAISGVSRVIEARPGGEATEVKS